MKRNDYYEALSSTPTIPDSVYDALPSFLKEVTPHFNDQRERDVVLTSCLTILSGCFTGIKGQYGNSWVGPSLFTFIVAPPANRKGSMKFSQKLGEPIQRKFEEVNSKARAKYEADFKAWKAVSKKNPLEAGDPPEKPNYPILFIPGNSSAAAIYWLLKECDGKAIICETEADSLAGAVKQDWGGFSHILRGAFHHEPITVARKSEELYQRIEYPHLAVLLTGTPDQVPRLIGSTEDGLCSRFLFYCYNQGMKWVSQAPCKDCVDLYEYFNKHGEAVAKIKKALDEGDCTFSLTDRQFQSHDEFFIRKMESIRKFEGQGASDAIKRLGLIAFRLAMIFTVLRQKDELKESKSLVCSDEDFSTVMGLIDVYFEHAMTMYAMLPKQSKTELSPKLRQFYTTLPVGEKFPRKKANEVGTEVGVSEKTVGNYLTKLVELGYLSNPEYGHYCIPQEE